MGTTYEPDGYTFAQGTWGTDADYEASATSVSGDGYIEFKLTAPGTDPYVIYSKYIPVDAGSPYRADAWLYGLVSSGTPANDKLRVSINWYTNAKAYISTSNVFGAAVLTTATGVWEQYGGVANAPATAKYARPYVMKDDVAFSARLDQFTFRAMPVAFSAYLSSSGTVVNGDTAIYALDTEVFDYGSNYNTGTGEFTAPAPGIYTFDARGIIDDLDADDHALIMFKTYDGTTTRFYRSQHYHARSTAENAIIAGSLTVLLAAGETCGVVYNQDTGGNQTLLGPSGSDRRTMFSGFRVE